MLLITVITVRTVSKMSEIQCFRPGCVLEPEGRQQSQLLFCFPSVGCVPREIREHRPKASPSYSSHHSIRGLTQQLSDAGLLTEDQEHLDMAINTLTRQWHWLKLSPNCVSLTLLLLLAPYFH